MILFSEFFVFPLDDDDVEDDEDDAFVVIWNGELETLIGCNIVFINLVLR